MSAHIGGLHDAAYAETSAAASLRLLDETLAGLRAETQPEALGQREWVREQLKAHVAKVENAIEALAYRGGYCACGAWTDHLPVCARCDEAWERNLR